MTYYSIGEICSILGIKPHVLRYWEREFQYIDPQKTHSGRRSYSLHDLQIIFRIKYLLYNRKYTIQGAREKLWEELQGDNLDIKAEVHSLRGKLIGLHQKTRNISENVNKILKPNKSRSKKNHTLPENKKYMVDLLLKRARRQNVERLREYQFQYIIRDGKDHHKPNKDLISKVCFVTLPRERLSVESFFHLIAQYSSLAHENSVSVLWFVMVPERQFDFYAWLSKEFSFWRKNQVVLYLVKIPDFFYITEEGECAADKDGEILRYYSGHTGVFLKILEKQFQYLLDRYGVRALYFHPFTQKKVQKFSPDFSFLTTHFRYNTQFSVKAHKINEKENVFQGTGEYIVSRTLLLTENILSKIRTEQKYYSSIIPSKDDDDSENRVFYLFKGNVIDLCSSAVKRLLYIL